MKTKKPLTRSGKKKLIITASGIAIVCICVGVGVLMLRKKAVMPVLSAGAATSATAEKGDISTTIAGTGNLSYASATDIQLPTGVQVDEVLVDAGDQVKAGDVLARLNANSITTALASTQEKIEALDEDISDAAGTATTTTLKTQVSGRVKKIYAAAGDDVSDVVLEHGALILLSIDGKMAVDVDTAATLAVGDTVNVTLSNGTVKTGTVESTGDGRVTVTLSDNGSPMDDAVTVQTTDGTDVGGGTLYIHQPLEIMATSGTVSSVYVSENQKVGAAASLMYLTDVTANAQYQQLLSDRAELTEELKLLLELSRTNTLTAEKDGIIQTVNVTGSASSGTASTGGGNGTAVAASTDHALQTLTSDSTAGAASLRLLSAEVNTSQSSTSQPESAQSSSPQSEPPQSGTAQSDAATGSDTSATGLTAVSLDTLKLSYPETGAQPQTQIGENDAFTGIIEWSPAVSDNAFQPETVYAATLTLTAKNGYYFSAQTIVHFDNAVVSGIEIGTQAEGNTLKFTLTFPATQSLDSNQGNGASGEPGDGASGGSSGDGSADNSANGSTGSGTSGDGNGTSGDGNGTSGEVNGGPADGTAGNGANGSGTGVTSDDTSGGLSGGSGISFAGGSYSGASGVSGSGSGVSGTSGSGSGASGSSASDGSGSDGTGSSSNMVTALTISDTSSMVLTINVDELDILAVAKGQTAKITMDAIEGQTFDGTITKVSNTASSSGGVTKYPVQITVPSNESMRDGMSASVTIVTAEKNDVIKIPVNALQERGNSVFVYTQQDSDTGTLSGEQEVETGLSDGDYVEIISGLSEGDTVYYTRTSGSDDANAFFGGMGGSTDVEISIPDGAGFDGSGFNGGQMPSGGGGQMPSGGGGGRPSN